MFDGRKLDVLNWVDLTGDLAFRAKMEFPHRLDPSETFSTSSRNDRSGLRSRRSGQSRRNGHFSVGSPARLRWPNEAGQPYFVGLGVLDQLQAMVAPTSN
jgi:hypothetical protein